MRSASWALSPSICSCRSATSCQLASLSRATVAARTCTAGGAGGPRFRLSASTAFRPIACRSVPTAVNA